MIFEFPQPMLQAKLLRRYKRFLADVELQDGTVLTVHCPNTGAMTGCAEQGWNVWLSKSDSPKRKYPYTWELVETDRGLACVHASLANKVVALALGNAEVPELVNYSEIKAEVTYGNEGSRADFLLKEGVAQCFVEVKSVTLLREGGVGAFPDAVSQRGSKHLRELSAMKAQGHRAVLFFCVLHSGIHQVSVADDIDLVYGQMLSEAVAAGVEVLAYGCDIDHFGIQLSHRIEFDDSLQAGLNNHAP